MLFLQKPMSMLPMRWHVKGLRLEYSSMLDKINIAPRFSIAYKLGKGSQASFAYGIFYQDPERKYLPSPNELTFMKATHYIRPVPESGQSAIFPGRRYFIKNMTTW